MVLRHNGSMVLGVSFCGYPVAEQQYGDCIRASSY